MTNKRGLINFFILFVLFVLATLAACQERSGPPTTGILSQPTDQSVVAGTTATFEVAARNASGYQWQRSTDNGTTFVDVSSATANSYTTPVTTLADSGTQYRVVITGAVNGVTSSAVTLTVTAVVVAPSISVHPAAQTITAGQNASFTVTASGSSLSYQWQRSTDGGANFTDIAGATNATLTLTAVPLADNAHQFRVVVSNSAGSVTSNAAILTVNVAQSAPAFTAQPASVSVPTPNTATFSVVATGTPGPTLQWQLSTNAGGSFADIAGATGSSYNTTATVAGDNGNQYRVIATNTAGATTSNAATLTVAVPAAPSFTLHPVNVTITEGQNAQFTVAVSGTPTPTLQWQLSTDSGVTWSSITGATSTVLDLIGAALANNGRQFRAVASNSAGVVNSSAAVLNVNPASAGANIVFTRGFGIQSSPSDVLLIKEDGTGEIALAATADDETFAAMAPGGRVVYRRVTGAQIHFYSVNAVGTGTVLLVSSVSSTDFPIFNGITPSGWVIYRRDTATAGRDIYAVQADGTGTATLANTAGNEDFATITPSGRIIYEGNRDLYSINADGTGRVALAASLDAEGFQGVSSAGQVVFYRCEPNFFSACSLYSIHENGGPATLLATNTFGDEYRFVDFTKTGQIVISHATSTGLRDLYINGTSIALANTVDSATYRGSTADGRVIYSRSTAIPNTSSVQGDLYIVNADGTNTIALGNSPDFHEGFNAVAPDGRIIYSRVGATDGLYDLYAVNADGTGAVALANSATFQEFFQVFTANGRVIYSRENGTLVSLFAVNTDGTGATFLPGGTSFLANTPSGKVLMSNNNNGNVNLQIVSPDGTGSIPLANTGNNESFGAVFP